MRSFTKNLGKSYLCVLLCILSEIPFSYEDSEIPKMH